jgi:hypothetical protein
MPVPARLCTRFALKDLDVDGAVPRCISLDAVRVSTREIAAASPIPWKYLGSFLPSCKEDSLLFADTVSQTTFAGKNKHGATQTMLSPAGSTPVSVADLLPWREHPTLTALPHLGLAHQFLNHFRCKSTTRNC